ncbi:hypothetical protein BpHYR1_048590 [Brachionus plicatilis]|uniref:Uncharacterized protein n=1 Tax=Brachionus plicatilis TaxID=10195 RepID=A0A3M7RV72_BRAPC|nr:hypothetical protein BpHYR1_048590 [Brachionus plicatilis]
MNRKRKKNYKIHKNLQLTLKEFFALFPIIRWHDSSNDIWRRIEVMLGHGRLLMLIYVHRVVGVVLDEADNLQQKVRDSFVLVAGLLSFDLSFSFSSWKLIKGGDGDGEGSNDETIDEDDDAELNEHTELELVSFLSSATGMGMRKGW